MEFPRLQISEREQKSMDKFFYKFLYHSMPSTPSPTPTKMKWPDFCFGKKAYKEIQYVRHRQTVPVSKRVVRPEFELLGSPIHFYLPPLPSSARGPGPASTGTLLSIVRVTGLQRLLQNPRNHIMLQGDKSRIFLEIIEPNNHEKGFWRV